MDFVDRQDMMTDKMLEEIKAREQAATPGPWVSVFGLKGFTIYDMREEKGKIIAKLFNTKGKYKQPDADFIAHARADIPALISEVERLTNCKCYDKCKLICMLDKYDEAVKERDMLKKALELMQESFERFGDDFQFSAPEVEDFIHQAQEQEGAEMTRTKEDIERTIDILMELQNGIVDDDEIVALGIGIEALQKILDGKLKPVVHCKNCDQWHDNYCDTFSAEVEPDFFCANGALMEQEGEKQ